MAWCEKQELPFTGLEAIHWTFECPLVLGALPSYIREGYMGNTD